MIISLEILRSAISPDGGGQVAMGAFSGPCSVQGMTWGECREGFSISGDKGVLVLWCSVVIGRAQGNKCVLVGGKGAVRCFHQLLSIVGLREAGKEMRRKVWIQQDTGTQNSLHKKNFPDATPDIQSVLPCCHPLHQTTQLLDMPKTYNFHVHVFSSLFKLLKIKRIIFKKTWTNTKCKI